jgi:hypothetical protein
LQQQATMRRVGESGVSLNSCKCSLPFVQAMRSLRYTGRTFPHRHQAPWARMGVARCAERRSRFHFCLIPGDISCCLCSPSGIRLMKLTVALIFMYLSTAVVCAETYNYSCKVCLFRRLLAKVTTDARSTEKRTRFARELSEAKRSVALRSRQLPDLLSQSSQFAPHDLSA